MARQASFTRRDTADETVFDVTPAQTSYAAYLAISLFYAFAWFLTQLPGLNGLGKIILLLTAGIHFITWNRYHRSPVTLVVSSHSLRVGTQMYGAADIRSLHLTQPWKDGGTEYEADDGYGSVGRTIRKRAEERSYALMLRLKSSSKLTPLARGLTYRSGKMLLDDVGQVLGLK